MEKVLVLGAKKFKGEIEGKQFDHTKVILAFKFSRKDENAVGYNTTARSEATWGDATNFEKLRNLRFPVELDIDYETIVKGREQVVEVYEVKVPPVQKAA